MSKFSSKILEKIKEKKVLPKPRWHFILMHTALIAATLITVALGSLAVAIVIRQLTLTDWELARIATGGHLKSVIVILPYLWLAFIGLTILLADTLFKHTKKGYRFRPIHIALATILVSILFGNVFYLTHADEPIEAALRQNIKPYQAWQEMRQKPLVAPDKGVIAGRLIKKELSEKEEWRMMDFRGKEWLVDVSTSKPVPDFELREGMPVGIRGARVNGEHFKVDRMKLWQTNKRNDKGRNPNTDIYKKIR